MKYERTYDKEIIRQIYTDDEMWTRTCHTGEITKDQFDPQVDDNSLHFVLFKDKNKVVGLALFKILDNNTADIHIQVPKKFRKQYSKRCGLQVLLYAWYELHRTLICEIPSFFPEVYYFVEKFGFGCYKIEYGTQYNAFTKCEGDMYYYKNNLNKIEDFLKVRNLI